MFISYRRGDDPFAVGRLRDALAQQFGEAEVFLDVLSVETGAHFEDIIEKTIEASNVVLVMIGDRWEATSQRDAMVDYVDLEVGFALAKGKRVIPVLLGQRPMPTREALSGSLAQLGSINAHRVRPDPDFKSDTADLVGLIGRTMPPSIGKHKAGRGRLATGMTIGALLLLAVAALSLRNLTSKGDAKSPFPTSAETLATTSSTPVQDTGDTTPTATPDAGLYPITDATSRELYGDSLDELPEIAVQVTGYQTGRGVQFDTVRLFESTPLLVPPLFDQVTGGMHECDRLQWIIRWKSFNPDVLVHAEVGPMFWYAGSDDAPKNPPSLAGYLSGDACEVAGFWFGSALRGSAANLVDVQYQLQVFDKLPTELEIPDCTPLVSNEAIPIQLCDEGENVRRVQQALVDRGIASLEVDGQFGPATKSAVEAFQLKMGLPVDGVVTTATWKALFPAEDVPTG